MAIAGPMPMMSGGQPTTAKARRTPSTGRPRRAASLRVVTTTAAAPSLTWLELPESMKELHCMSIKTLPYMPQLNPWCRTTLMKNQPDDRLLWETTPMTDHPNERPPWWKATLKICFSFIWNRKQGQISRKKYQKWTGVTWYIWQVINGLKQIWIYVNSQMIIINGKISIMFPLIRTLDIHGPCLPLKNDKFVLESYIQGSH